MGYLPWNKNEGETVTV